MAILPARVRGRGNPVDLDVRELLLAAAAAAEGRLHRLASCENGPQSGVAAALEATARALVPQVRAALRPEPEDPVARYHAAVRAARAQRSRLSAGGAR